MISDNDFQPQNPIRDRKVIQKEPIACHLRPAASPETGSLFWSLSFAIGYFTGNFGSHRQKKRGNHFRKWLPEIIFQAKTRFEAGMKPEKGQNLIIWNPLRARKRVQGYGSPKKSGGRRGRTASCREEIPPLLIKNVDRCRLIYKLFYREKKEKSTIEKFALCPTSTYTRRACAVP